MDEYDVDAALQAALDRLTLLSEASAVLASTLDAVEGLRRVCRVLVPGLGDWVAADLVDESGQVTRVGIAHRDPDAVASGMTGPLPRLTSTTPGPLARVLRGAGPLLLTASQLPPEGAELEAFNAVTLDLLARLGGQTLVVAPLRARRRVLGTLTVVRAEGRAPLGEEDLALIEDLAHRIALALDNATLYAETRGIAERLQRSLLPELPVIAGLGIAAFYAPATATARIGGDWYDCFRLPSGDVALIIGDVTGHDLQSAVVMSQLRNMLRGIACDRQEPPEVILRRLDTAASALYPHQTATCLYALLKGPEGGPFVLEWSSAGHPPPLLVTRDGDTAFLEGGHGILLGAHPESERASATSTLPEGSTLLLYTDGLIERRGEGLDRGLNRLRQHAAALAGRHVNVMCDELRAGLSAEADSDDDIALIALRLPTGE